MRSITITCARHPWVRPVGLSVCVCVCGGGGFPIPGDIQRPRVLSQAVLTGIKEEGTTASAKHPTRHTAASQQTKNDQALNAGSRGRRPTPRPSAFKA